MLVGIGTDLVNTQQIAEYKRQSKVFIDEIFTNNEIRYCESMAFPETHYAGRFAAKEAFFKALGTGIGFGMKFKDVEVIQDALGKPLIKLYRKAKILAEKKNAAAIHLSITHSKTSAIAFVVIQKPNMEADV
ncbi:holo-ACP synthase [Aureivirga sp. CE67]|uniref:holo-ACP synthase n=1 Tax=Aureivirga sp. CE67 TaxID=1788983 RepID=UPI0018C933F3|nr:holo-ACP synthase [Aureivirga sp. CE67]